VVFDTATFTCVFNAGGVCVICGALDIISDKIGSINARLDIRHIAAFVGKELDSMLDALLHIPGGPRRHIAAFVGKELDSMLDAAFVARGIACGHALGSGQCPWPVLPVLPPLLPQLP